MGDVYCAALTATPINTNIVKLTAISAGGFTSFSTPSPGNLTKSVTVQSLSPSTEYKIYCYVENVKSIGKWINEYLKYTYKYAHTIMNRWSDLVWPAKNPC